MSHTPPLPIESLKARQPSLIPAGLVQPAIKAQIRAAKIFGDIENLSIVHSKVLHHLVNSIQAGDRITLDLVLRKQIRLR